MYFPRLGYPGTNPLLQGWKLLQKNFYQNIASVWGDENPSLIRDLLDILPGVIILLLGLSVMGYVIPYAFRFPLIMKWTFRPFHILLHACHKYDHSCNKYDQACHESDHKYDRKYDHACDKYDHSFFSSVLRQMEQEARLNRMREIATVNANKTD